MALKKDFSVVDALIESYKKNRLAHALLFRTHSRSEPEQKNEIKSFLQTLLCLNMATESKACQRCPSCLALQKAPNEANTHPDYLESIPEKKSGYSVEEVRQIIQFFSLKKALSPKRVLWLQKAEELNTSSGNALLKFLEEPQPDVYIVLSSNTPEKILSTILSRCHLYNLSSEAENFQDLKQQYSQWNEFFQWLQSGLQTRNFQCPADLESFWTQRTEALHEMDEVFQVSWKLIQENIGDFDRQSALRCYDFFQEWQEGLNRIRQYGNPITNWMHLKNSGIRGKLWKP